MPYRLFESNYFIDRVIGMGHYLYMSTILFVIGAVVVQFFARIAVAAFEVYFEAKAQRKIG